MKLVQPPPAHAHHVSSPRRVNAGSRSHQNSARLVLHSFVVSSLLFLLLVISISPHSFLPFFSNGNLARSCPSRFFSPTCPRGPHRPFRAHACTHRRLDHAAPHALNAICAHSMSGVIIPELMHRIPSKLRTQACLGPYISIWINSRGCLCWVLCLKTHSL